MYGLWRCGIMVGNWRAGWLWNRGEAMSTLVFMSYSHENADVVTRLRQDLQARGVRVWIDHESLAPGTPDWDEAIRVALRSVDAALFIASPDARKSLYVRDELQVARMYERAIYPIWVAGDHWIDCVPIGWGATQYVDARGAKYADALKALVVALKGASPAPGTPILPASPSIAATQPASPARAIIADPAELARQVQAQKQSAQGAAPAPTYNLSRLRMLLARKDWKAADEESKLLLQTAARLARGQSFDSEMRVQAIPSGLLLEMDDEWRAASGKPLRERNWIVYAGSMNDFRKWARETWLEYRLKELGR